jgi:hypothetical protein
VITLRPILHIGGTGCPPGEDPNYWRWVWAVHPWNRSERSRNPNFVSRNFREFVDDVIRPLRGWFGGHGIIPKWWWRSPHGVKRWFGNQPGSVAEEMYQRTEAREAGLDHLGDWFAAAGNIRDAGEPQVVHIGTPPVQRYDGIEPRWNRLLEKGAGDWLQSVAEEIGPLLDRRCGICWDQSCGEQRIKDPTVPWLFLMGDIAGTESWCEATQADYNENLFGRPAQIREIGLRQRHIDQVGNTSEHYVPITNPEEFHRRTPKVMIYMGWPDWPEGQAKIDGDGFLLDFCQAAAEHTAEFARLLDDNGINAELGQPHELLVSAARRGLKPQDFLGVAR